jgi:hypothetical protein
MIIELKRFSSNNESTIGLLFINGKFQCYTLEDEYREVKVMHETRIPNGTYKIVLAKWGSHHERYKVKFAEIHKGMLLLEDVPKFTGILIHMGNTDDHTSGCILLGNTANNNQQADGFIGESEKAYRNFYPIVANAIEAGEQVVIKVSKL